MYRGSVAQSVERVSHNHEVVSSILTTPTFLYNCREEKKERKKERISITVRKEEILFIH